MGIEKIGLPAKPAAKGATWVLDASSCQTCQTPFSLFNRKHHCRRCGGLFCGNCSNSKAILRGQGDGAVRVCDPCKKLEEAARFQARHRGKTPKGGSKGTSLADDDALLKEVFGDDAHSVLPESSELTGDEDAGNHETPEDKAGGLKENTSPEKLREEAAEQKKVYSTLKREGKKDAALQAFKRHKELGREADALELSLKKMAVAQRKAAAEEQFSAANSQQKSDKESPESAKEGNNLSKGDERDVSYAYPRKRKPSKDDGDEDILRSLKDLGWDDADLSEKPAKKGPTSDMDLLAEISDSAPNKSTAKRSVKQNPSQLEVLAHKRQALALKREGKPAEAKEELRKAKMLEKKLEEMALFGDEEEEEEDDDELGALMRSLEKEATKGTDKGKDWSLPTSGNDIPLSLNLADDDDDVGTNVDVTDDDINDPGMIAALRSMGWVEEAAALERSRAPESGGPEAFQITESVNDEVALQREILNLKRRALTLKREGNVGEAKVVLQEAKTLEHKLEILKSRPIASKASAKGKVGGTGAMSLEDVLQDNDDGVEVDDEDMRDPAIMAALRAMGFEEEETAPPLQTLVKPNPLEKKSLQDEILSIKRSALALRKQGKAEEAREELRQAKLLETKLQKMQADFESNGLPSIVTSAKKSKTGPQISVSGLPLEGFVSEDEEAEAEVSAEDFMDPELVAALKSVGWKEEDTFVQDREPQEKEEAAAVSERTSAPVRPYVEIKLSQKDHARKLQAQRELLAIKRKALGLKREGKGEEAKLELKKGKTLELEIEAIENAALSATEDFPKEPVASPKHSAPPLPSTSNYDSDEEVTDADMHDPELLDALKRFGWKPEPERKRSPPHRSTNAETAASVEVVHDPVQKLNVANPPYKKPAEEPTPDPIWLAIMNSASKKHEQVQTTKEEIDGRGGSQGEQSFGGEFGEIGTVMDVVPPVFGNRSSVANEEQTVSRQGQHIDMLSGDALEAPVGPAPEKTGLDEDEDDDVFDSGLLAALQNIGMGPPLKGSASQKLQGNATSLSDAVGSVSAGQQNNARNADGSPVRPAAGRSSSPKHNVMETVDKAAGSSAVDRHVLGGSAAAAVGVPAPTIQEEIKVHKRRALALKREGKQSEAREELRQAKLLEKQLESVTSEPSDKHQSSPDGSAGNRSAALSSASPEKVSQPVTLPKAETIPNVRAQSHKEQLRQEVRHGKDRMKLQQESLAHKRKALGLRREGRTDEADAEFELAKTLEKQMEDLDGGAKAGLSGKASLADMGIVEDLLDPKLKAALRGLGWSDGDLHGGAANVSGGTGPSVPAPSKSGQKANAQGGTSAMSRPASGSAAHAREMAASESGQQRRPTGASSSGAVAGPSGKVHYEGVAIRNSQPGQLSVGGNRAAAQTIEERGGGTNKANTSDRATLVGESAKSTGVGTRANETQTERRNLEDRIKQEKIKAVELKRAGRQAEAIEVLKGSKRLEKQLVSLTS